jgi:hypothetical protein
MYCLGLNLKKNRLILWPCHAVGSIVIFPYISWHDSWHFKHGQWMTMSGCLLEPDIPGHIDCQRDSSKTCWCLNERRNTSFGIHSSFSYTSTFEVWQITQQSHAASSSSICRSDFSGVVAAACTKSGHTIQEARRSQVLNATTISHASLHPEPLQLAVLNSRIQVATPAPCQRFKDV